MLRSCWRRRCCTAGRCGSRWRPGWTRRRLGTDAVSISAAIERADGPGGVVVLMDLGSALLSAELALDLLDDPTARDRVTLSPAPIVEGLVVAAVAAAGGASRAEVAAEARDALMGKAAHLAVPTADVVERAAPRGGGRDLHGGEPARPARPAGRAAGQRGTHPRRVGAAPQPHHRCRPGARGKPEPGRHARRRTRPRGRGAGVRAPGPGGRRAPPRPWPRVGSTRPTRTPSRSGPRLRPNGRVPAAPCRRHRASPSARSEGSPSSRARKAWSSSLQSPLRNGDMSWRPSRPLAGRSSTPGS